MRLSDCGASDATARRIGASALLPSHGDRPVIVRAALAVPSRPEFADARHQYDVLGIGNAIVDVIARTEDDFLVKHGMNKGAMALIDEPRAEAIYASMGPAIEISGGSGANTIAGVASFGARAAFVGKVKDDDARQGLRARHPRGRRCLRHAAGLRRPLDRALLHAGDAGRRAHHEHVSRRRAEPASRRYRRRRRSRRAAITYLEGYLWDPPHAKEAFRKAASIAHGAGRMVALTLSDAFCVDRYRDEFLNLMRTGAVDLIFANESELKSLYETADFDTARRGAAQRREACRGDAQRKGLRGRLARKQRSGASAAPIDKLVDATGAGDLFAAGFLTGLARGQDHRNCRAARRASRPRK